jgi:hypothetical protein
MRAKITSALQTLIFREFPKRGKLLSPYGFAKNEGTKIAPVSLGR